MTTNTMTLDDGTEVQFQEIKRMIAKADVISGGGAPTADQQVDQRTREIMASSGRSYSEAYSLALQLYPELKKRWVAESNSRGRK
jgi:hypothetical protein